MQETSVSLPGIKELLLVVVIIALAVVGTMAVIKLIRKFFPKSDRIEARTREKIDEFEKKNK